MIIRINGGVGKIYSGLVWICVRKNHLPKGWKATATVANATNRAKILLIVASRLLHELSVRCAKRVSALEKDQHDFNLLPTLDVAEPMKNSRIHKLD